MAYTNTNQVDCITLFDGGDRLGSHLTLYISITLVAIKKNYRIQYIKDKHCYRYADSIFVQYLFNFIDKWNEAKSGRIEYRNEGNYFTQFARRLLDIQCDFITMFKQTMFEDCVNQIDLLAQSRHYSIPFDINKTILVHLRLDDKATTYFTDSEVQSISKQFRDIIHTNNELIFPQALGQSAFYPDTIQKQIDKLLEIYKDYEVLIITDPISTHSLPYKTISTNDESYDLYLLSRCKILLGSRSTFSFAALYFGNHDAVYYPLWEQIVTYGLTTMYDSTKNIHIF